MVRACLGRIDHILLWARWLLEAANPSWKPPPKAAGPFVSLKRRAALCCPNQSKERGRLDVKAIFLALLLTSCAIEESPILPRSRPRVALKVRCRTQQVPNVWTRMR